MKNRPFFDSPLDTHFFEKLQIHDRKTRCFFRKIEKIAFFDFRGPPPGEVNFFDFLYIIFFIFLFLFLFYKSMFI